MSYNIIIHVCVFLILVASQSARPGLRLWLLLSITCKWFSSLKFTTVGVRVSECAEVGIRGRGCQPGAFTCKRFPLQNSLVLIKSPDSTRRKQKIIILQMNMWQSRVGNWEEMRWNTREWCIGNREWKPVKNGSTWKAGLETTLTYAVQGACSYTYWPCSFTHSCKCGNI